MGLLFCREYGEGGELAIVLHGGPAAAGSVEALAKELGRYCRVVEPFQREAGEVKLTVDGHVEDLYDLIKVKCEAEKPTLVGHSWGAMLALAYAARYGDSVKRLILVGCGTFDEASRSELRVRLEKLMTKEKQKELREIEAIANVDERKKRSADFHDGLYAYEMIEGDRAAVRFDLESHTQSWNDMLRQQEMGVYPQAFSKIRNPVVMIHGQFDPHPGRMIFANLRQYAEQLEYIELEKCGHSPWEEKFAQDEFYDRLKEIFARAGESLCDSF